MTRLASLLRLADSIARNETGAHTLAAVQQAANLLDLLSAPNTCGWERPEVVDYRSALGGDEPRMIAVPESWATRVSPADARVMAVMLLMACDAAEGKDEQ